MDWTDRHCRYFHHLLTRHARLSTEVVTTRALLHGDVPRHFDFNAAELQLGAHALPDRAAEPRLDPICVLVPERVCQRVQRGVVLAHQCQRGTQDLGTALLGFVVSHGFGCSLSRWFAAARGVQRQVSDAARQGPR